MVPNPDWPADKVIDDDSWADVEILKKLEVHHVNLRWQDSVKTLVLELSTYAEFPLFGVQLWYNVSKTLAEKAAWDFAAEEELQLVVLNPSLVLGPTLTPAATPSLRVLMQLLGGRSFATFRVLQLCTTSVHCLYVHLQCVKAHF